MPAALVNKITNKKKKDSGTASVALPIPNTVNVKIQGSGNGTYANTGSCVGLAVHGVDRAVARHHHIIAVGADGIRQGNGAVSRRHLCCHQRGVKAAGGRVGGSILPGDIAGQCGQQSVRLVGDVYKRQALKASNSVGKNSMKLWATVPTALTSEPYFISARQLAVPIDFLRQPGFCFQ